MRHAGATEFYDFNDAYFSEIFSLSANRMLCFHEGRVIAGAIYLTNGNNMESHLTASNNTGRDLRAGHLIIHEMKRLGAESGCRFLHLGGGTDGSADNRLLSFKKNFSERLEDFYIGNRVFFEAPYRRLKKDWEKRTGSLAQRILFYR
jgi:lipid II:glycine glycyltransferase (peptidoglycan interpeptide bridge formation enzyme)